MDTKSYEEQAIEAASRPRRRTIATRKSGGSKLKLSFTNERKATITKDTILKELHYGEKSKCYAHLIDNDYAFDVVVNGVKLEIHPRWLNYYPSGAEVVNCKTFDQPIEIKYDELVWNN